MRTRQDREGLTLQLETERRSVGFDSYDMSVREILSMVGAREINIAPEYQRKFIWDRSRESEFVESVFLDIPIPPLFMATNRNETWEVVDGVQRISTLIHFCGTPEQHVVIDRPHPLIIQDLEKLTTFNMHSFEDLPNSIKLKFWTRPLR